ncbi:hypothetical protein [Nocardioides sp.]|uniref:hypothetical protein n=1 Tax=Nocardioides sp. TaxID=35761 RepID=UPI0026152E4C|nr:hypothetical protein [Nocardioides sp.]MDI6910051.1 hypothetical protein [Nocardioides sp.]
MSALDAPAHALASAGGLLLAGTTRAVAAVRPAAKPLHPRGEVTRGRLFRSGARPATGVPWLDEAGEDDVLVRRSRAIGLPVSAPDIHGLAVRVPRPDGGYGDLLLASTGWGRLTRFVLTASRSPRRRPMTTLLPYRTARGPLVIGARATGEESFELAAAEPEGEWVRFAELRLSTLPPDDTSDADVSFDPVANRLPGLEQYDAVERLREPAYHSARAGRSR